VTNEPRCELASSVLDTHDNQNGGDFLSLRLRPRNNYNEQGCNFEQCKQMSEFTTEYFCDCDREPKSFLRHLFEEDKRCSYEIEIAINSSCSTHNLPLHGSLYNSKLESFADIQCRKAFVPYNGMLSPVPTHAACRK